MSSDEFFDSIIEVVEEDSDKENDDMIVSPAAKSCLVENSDDRVDIEIPSNQSQTSKEQFGLIASFIDGKNFKILSGTTFINIIAANHEKRIAKDQYSEMWNHLADELNQKGPANHTSDEWMQIWSNHKLKKKKKTSRVLSEANVGVLEVVKGDGDRENDDINDSASTATNSGQVENNDRVDSEIQVQSKQPKTSKEQFSIIAAFMDGKIVQILTDITFINIITANDEETIAKDQYNEMWINLADELNEIGPAKHTSVEWRRIWSTHKYNKKRKTSKVSEADGDAKKARLGIEASWLTHSCLTL